MRIVIFLQSGVYYAEVVKDNGDEHRLTTAMTHRELLEKITDMAPDLPVEYHEPMVGQKEICEIMEWEYPKNRSMIKTYLNRGKFPEPYQTLSTGPIWKREWIYELRDSRRER